MAFRKGNVVRLTVRAMNDLAWTARVYEVRVYGG